MLTSVCKCLHALWNPLNNLIDQHHQVWTDIDGAINYPVEHVFHGPRQIPNYRCSHHPAAALQGVERPAQFR